MKNAMGIILTGGNKSGMKELSAIRATAAIPVGGKYRAIDFVLSNMVNSGITNIGVLTQYNFRSLMDHLGTGKEWDLDRENGGLFIFPPYLSDDGSGWYKGTADAMYNNLTYLLRSSQEYVIISVGNSVCKINFEKLLDYHIDKGADITIAYRDMSDLYPEDLPIMGILSVDNNERITDFEEKPLRPKGTLGSMGIYVMKRELLIYLLEECIAHGNYDFVRDVLIKKLDSLKIYGYRFNSYWRSISSIKMYYRCNMELLDPDVCCQLFVDGGKIYTKVKDEPPAKYNDEAEVRNSIIGDGCIIEGTVENSVLFRGVTVKKGACIKNSIIMQGSVIESGSSLQYAVVDKNVLITEGKNLKGDDEWPIIVGRRTVV
ncbi:glucose-1-phosphate adenylyltransferase subunit GlgD [Pseudobacteroides cellulosolvens]|uniref:Glucose-1-phosphate adenylyltransferase, GlgD subunit n=1 Tax=Pseudobacteroides cellulosolvens ATCC 35603 = DSM 2933 TaxID=398512 RepID=A0A0L6JSE6_9FIRM|nr:glucose-1-phosphate adenylyltransferase subunit GlgD [Pseudobacteroides cellulosolvens]KNY28708.1 glucose-1-phosphate adenylyltransferase, GlgD subunit [Pseudobacteroides cellulosolvens ATCC 35603 = DSM 2933]